MNAENASDEQPYGPTSPPSSGMRPMYSSERPQQMASIASNAALWLAGKSRARAAVLGNLYPAGCLLSLFTGCVGRLETVWAISDIFNGLMAIPNLIALIALSGVVARETRENHAAPFHLLET